MRQKGLNKITGSQSLVGCMPGVFHFKECQQREESEWSMFLTSEEEALGSLDRELYYTLVQQCSIHPFFDSQCSCCRAGTAINAELARVCATIPYKADLSRPRMTWPTSCKPAGDRGLIKQLSTTTAGMLLWRAAWRGSNPVVPAPQLWGNHGCCQKSTKLLVWKLPLATPEVREQNFKLNLCFQDLAIITLQEVRRLSRVPWGHKAVQEPCELNHYDAWRHSAGVLYLWGCSFQRQHLCKSCCLYRNT